MHGRNPRDRERRAQFQMPTGMQVNLDTPPLRVNADVDAGWQSVLAQAPTWADIAWLQTQTRLPILLKGVLHEDDARQAQQLGIQGLIVSNHGGRTLDTAVSTAWALP